MWQRWGFFIVIIYPPFWVYVIFLMDAVILFLACVSTCLYHCTEKIIYSCRLFALVAAAAAASTGVEVLGSFGSTTNMAGLITALILCAFNVTLLGALFVRWIKNRRKRNATEASTASGQTNSAIQSEAGSVRNLNSLMFSAPSLGDGDDSISTNSSISSLS